MNLYACATCGGLFYGLDSIQSHECNAPHVVTCHHCPTWSLTATTFAAALTAAAVHERTCSRA